MAFEPPENRDVSGAETLPSPSPEAFGATEKKSSVFGTLVRLAISVGAIAIVLAMTDFNDAVAHASGQNFLLVGCAVVAMLVQLCLGAMRWHAVRAGLGARDGFGSTLQIYYVGSFFSTYVFSGFSGDLMRGWLSYKRGMDAVSAANSVILDRVAILVGVALMMLPATPWFFVKFGNGLGGWAPSLCALGLFAAVFATAQLHLLPQRWSSNIVVRLAQKLGAGMREIFMRPRIAFKSATFAIMAQVMLSVATFALAQSLGVELSFWDCLIVMQIVAILNAIPISVGGWGVREAAMIGLLGLIGVPAAAALLLSVELGLIGLLVNLPGGVIWLLLKADKRTGETSAILRPATS